MKKYISIFLLLVSCHLAYATTLTPDKALSRALDITLPSGMCRISAQNMRLVYADSQEEPTYYIFTRENNIGYLLVSADNVASPILGYSDCGHFDPEDMPENMLFWLSCYSQQIREVSKKGEQYSSISNGLEYKDPIAPLLTTQWSQTEPYNLLCPVVFDQLCVTGCVSTALSQIMAYHKYPVHGSGSFSYINNGISLEADFENTYYDWENMLPYYNNNAYTEREAQAVATLMYQTGVAFEMNYSPVSSGAYSDMPVKKLPLYFGYDDNMFLAYRCYHTYSEWHQMVYDQLSNVGPVELNGSDDLGSGHSFVCDGYDGKGYFHINWGWGGLSDGYFLLDALSPDAQGVGGAILDFTNRIAMQGGIQPAGAEFVRQELVADQFSIKEGTYSTESYLWGLIKPDDIMFQFIFVNNFTHRTLRCQMGAKFINDNTGEEIVLELPSYLEYAYGESGSPSVKITTPDDMPLGKYTVTPCWRESDGAWHDLSVLVGSPRSVSITVEDKQWIVAATPTKAAVKCDNLQAKSEIEWGKDCNMRFTLQNIGDEEYYGTVRGVIKNEDGEICGMTPSIVVSIGGQSEQDYNETLPFIIYSISEPEEGDYTLCLIDGYLTQISNGVAVYLTPDSGSIDSISADRDEDIIVYTLSGIKIFQGKRGNFRPSKVPVIILPIKELKTKN